MAAPGGTAAREQNMLSTPVGRELLKLFDERTRARPWRLGSQPFPLIVLEAETPDVNTDAYVEELEAIAADAGIPHIAPAPAPGSAPAIGLLDAMIDQDAWSGLRPGFGRLRYPRSELVRSFEEATRRAAQKNAERRGSTTALEEWNGHAALRPWSRTPLRAPFWWSTVILLVAAVLGGVAQGLADKIELTTLLLISMAILAVVLLSAGLTTRTIWLPILSRIGLGSRYRWFAASSFFAGLGGGGFVARLRRVLDRPGPEFSLQMKTLAFLEDVRAAHRKLSPTLRGLKRPVPPVVFLKGVTTGNGGVELLSAMSDVRSRRSELHPLLVVASAAYADRDDLNGSATAFPRRIEDRYTEWERSLNTTQAPSQRVSDPWLLRLPIPHETPPPDLPPPLSPRRRPRWTWLWSWWSLLLLMVLAAVGGSYLQAWLASAHCSVRFPFSANVDTVLRIDTAGTHECVGVSTGGVRFERHTRSTALDGGLRPPDPRHTGGEITLADLQRRIDDENAEVARGGFPYVTVLYAGMMTAAERQEQSAVSSIRELAGAYAAQLASNDPTEPGGYGSPLKIRLLVVNTGQNMAYSGVATDRILSIARRDPTVVGVVGMGRNTQASHDAIDRLGRAGLAVVDTVNSSDELPSIAHFYGLAATDHDESVVAAYAARKALGGGPVGRMLIVSRGTGPGREYGSELADDARGEIRATRTDHLVYQGIEDIADSVRTECERSGDDPYRLVYFAGRAEDMNGLMTGLSNGGCTRHPLTVIGGDEISRASFGTERGQITLPANLTVYFTTFNDLDNLVGHQRDLQVPFFTVIRNTLGIASSRSPLLADGQMAMAYDATTALYEAGRKAFHDMGLAARDDGRVAGSRSVTSGVVLAELPHMEPVEGATGMIDFREGSATHGLTLVKVSLRGGKPYQERICGRLNGGQPVPGLAACPVPPAR